MCFFCSLATARRRCTTLLLKYNLKMGDVVDVDIFDLVKSQLLSDKKDCVGQRGWRKIKTNHLCVSSLAE